MSRRRRVLRPLVVSLAAALLSNAASAQEQPPSVGTVRGVLFDSLARAPLGGAMVSVAGRFATTDAAGRFAADSVPAGPQLLTFSHPALDSLGLGTFATEVAVAAGRETAARLATPSRATIYRKLCAAAPPASGPAGIVFGVVRDATTDARLAGASALVSWLAFERLPDRVRTRTPTVHTRTDSSGTYYACGVETGIGLDVRAASGSYASGAIEVSVDSVRGIARQDLYLSLDSAAHAGAATLSAEDSTALQARLRAAADSTPAPLDPEELAALASLPRGTAALVGVVRDSAGGPVTGARVTVAGTAALATTDDRGRFRLTRLPAGSQQLEARHLGHAPARIAVRLRPDDTTHVELALERATLLNTVRVAARRPAGRERAAFERRRTMALGRFIVAEQLRHVQTIEGVLGTVPGLKVIDGVIRIRRLANASVKECVPAVYVDGKPFPNEWFLREFRPGEFAGIEIYRSHFTVPAEFMGHRDAQDCGAIVAWTKRGTDW